MLPPAISAQHSAISFSKNTKAQSVSQKACEQLWLAPIAVFHPRLTADS
jgi:hypothetical protein